ncbi:MAG: aminoacetone oxidase family FAD-binding enzyme, partial [Clostridia bacterium]|nr:aminoacetone oxidase family FAD-binding enzyme [Clostridia bacterium]
MQTDFKVAIIGGGSAGLFAGTLLAKNFHGNVAILERLDRVGKKLLATGNGQGNLTNTDLSLSHYHGDIRLAESVFGVASGKETSAHLESIGVTLSPDERGRVYPSGRQASAVLDMLRKAFLDAGGKEITGAEIIRVTPTANGFTLTAKNELSFTAQYVMVATGGKSGQGMGTDGAFYEVLKTLGHTVTPTRPSLTQLKTDTNYLKNLKGVRVYASLSGESATETGDVLFTDTGISGDATFRLSARLNHPERGQVFVDFLPHLAQAELTELLLKKYRALPL